MADPKKGGTTYNSSTYGKPAASSKPKGTAYNSSTYGKPAASSKPKAASSGPPRRKFEAPAKAKASEPKPSRASKPSAPKNGPPNRMTAYKEARASERPKGMGYTELFFDNLIGLDNGYDSTIEDMADAYNADKIGFLKNAGKGMYEGAKSAVMNPLDTLGGIASSLYDSGANVLSTLGPGGEAEYLDSALNDMYGVSYEDATDYQVSKAREAMLGDVMNVASVVPVIRGGTKAVGTASKAVDAAQRDAAKQFFRETRPTFDPSSASDARFYHPSRPENAMMANNPTASEQMYLAAVTEAEKLLNSGTSPQAVQEMTGIVPVPLRTATGGDHGYRLIAALDPEDYTAYRPVSNLDIDVKMDDTLGRNEAGYFGRREGGRPWQYTIGINPKLSAAEKANTLTHEMTHGDLMEGHLGWNEYGSNPNAAFDQKMDSLKLLDSLISTSKTADEKDMYRSMRQELADMTSYELYSRNPGEMLARLSEGNSTMAKRLTPSQVINPYIAPGSIPKRYSAAIETLLRSEQRPYMQALIKKFGEKLPSFLQAYDPHLDVPMDMDKAVIADPNYSPLNPARVVNPPPYNYPDPWANVGEAPFINVDDELPF